MTSLAAELQALADQIKARRSFSGPRLLRTNDAHGESAPVYASALPTYRTCCLCGGPSDRFTCAACDEGMRELGL